ncbi:hypothetical protein [Desulfonema magnum]|uniref:Uncharacterized protein n=1 Tax=Desulfonema magnum TaxID=45655 RepID=A0A975BW19_9BACT|nr:hypothetical protein [Desulfonema magnum]QTA92693.1 Uncharacterized protein dnm_087810 [Desulfonema magnum]
MKQKKLTRKKMKAVKGGWTFFNMILMTTYFSTDTGKGKGGLDFIIDNLKIKIR